jgi:hypothetical protein
MEPALNLAGIRTTGPMLGPVNNLHNVFAIFNASHFDYAIEINNSGAMNTGKPGRVKFLS